MNKKVSRSLHLIAAEGVTTRTETYKDREYLVVPVVALMEGVIWPVNAETPEYVTSESFSIAPETWNGRPVFPGHPERDGTQVLGNVPEILESEQIGIIFNAGVVDGKLTMEAWLNKEDAEAVGGAAADIYDRAASGKPIEISVGAVVLMEETKGVYNGQQYDGKWIEVFSDHLALLPAGDIGACSFAMGCGVRAATRYRIAKSGYEYLREEEGLPGKKNETPKKRRSLLQKLSGFFRAASPAGYSDNDVRTELLDALEEKEPNLRYNGWVEAVYDNEGLVVYCLYDESYDMDYYVRDFKWDGKTAVLGDLNVEVIPRTVYEVEDDANPANEVLITQLRTAQKLSAPCGCGGKSTEVVAASSSNANQGEEGMKTREERIAAMITASAALIAAGTKVPEYKEADKTWLTAVPDAHFDVLEAAVTTPKEPDKKPPEPKPEPEPVPPTPPVSVAETNLTEEQFMKAAPASLKRTLARAQAADTARRIFLTTRLKTAQTEYTETQLNAMDLDEIERLARMLKVAGPVEADYSGMGAPRETFAHTDDAPPPPDLNKAVIAARAARK